MSVDEPVIDCPHMGGIVVWTGPDDVPLAIPMWSCRDCFRRFYPACATCVDVGHRNVVHPPLAVDAQWRAIVGEERQRLYRIIEVMDDESGAWVERTAVLDLLVQP